LDPTDANREAIGRVLASEPWLVGVKPAGEVVPRFAPNLILHAAPPAAWDDLSDLLRGGLVGAALFEQLAATEEEAEAKLRAGEIVLGAAQDHSAMAGGAGSITASLPVLVVEDRTNGNRAFHFLMEGFGKTLILGMYDEEVHERLVWIRDELAPALDAALEALGGIDARALMTEALRRGDELHNRTPRRRRCWPRGSRRRWTSTWRLGGGSSTSCATTRSSSSASRWRQPGSRSTRGTASRARAW